MANEFFRELMADALGKSSKDRPEALKEEDKICDVFVQRIYKDDGMKQFDYGVSVIIFHGNELLESSTYAIFHKWSLSKRYAKALVEFFKEQGYEAHLKGEVGA